MNKQEAINEVYHWQENTNAEWFTAQLFDLWMKADPGNRDRLALAFPEECEAIEEWYVSADPMEYFRSHGLFNEENPKP